MSGARTSIGKHAQTLHRVHAEKRAGLVRDRRPGRRDRDDSRRRRRPTSTVTTRVRGEISRCNRSGVKRSACVDGSSRTSTPRRRSASHGIALAGNSLSQSSTSSPGLPVDAQRDAFAPRRSCWERLRSRAPARRCSARSFRGTRPLRGRTERYPSTPAAACACANSFDRGDRRRRQHAGGRVIEIDVALALPQTRSRGSGVLTRRRSCPSCARRCCRRGRRRARAMRARKDSAFRGG